MSHATGRSSTSSAGATATGSSASVMAQPSFRKLACVTMAAKGTPASASSAPSARPDVKNPAVSPRARQAMALRSRGTYVSSSRRSGWITGVSSLAVQIERQCCMKTVCRSWIRSMIIASSSTTSRDGGRRYAGIGAGSRIRYMSRAPGTASRLAACPPLHAMTSVLAMKAATVLPGTHAVKLGDYSSLRRGSRERMGPALRIHAPTYGHQVAPEGTCRHVKRYDLWSRMRVSRRVDDRAGPHAARRESSGARSTRCVCCRRAADHRPNVGGISRPDTSCARRRDTCPMNTARS